VLDENLRFGGLVLIGRSFGDKIKIFMYYFQNVLNCFNQLTYFCLRRLLCALLVEKDEFLVCLFVFTDYKPSSASHTQFKEQRFVFCFCFKFAKLCVCHCQKIQEKWKVLFLVLKRQGRVKKCAPPEVVIKNVTKHSASLASTRPKFNTCATKKKKKRISQSKVNWLKQMNKCVVI
jgi:hypothetical protein